MCRLTTEKCPKTGHSNCLQERIRVWERETDFPLIAPLHV